MSLMLIVAAIVIIDTTICYQDLSAAKQQGLWQTTMAQEIILTMILAVAVADPATSFALADGK